MDVCDIAKICHNVNKAYCESMGDLSQPDWKDAPSWQKESAMAGVAAHLMDKSMTGEDSHKSWMAQKQREGWVYGETKDPVAKTHPCMVPYKELSKEQQTKDHLFKAVVDACRWD